MYSEMFPDVASHKKYKVGSTGAANWWIRSASANSYGFCCVGPDSGDWYGGSTGNADNSHGVALCFCT